MCGVALGVTVSVFLVAGVVEGVVVTFSVPGPCVSLDSGVVIACEQAATAISRAASSASHLMRVTLPVRE